MENWDSIIVVDDEGRQLQIRGPPDYTSRFQNATSFREEQLCLQGDRQFAYNLLVADRNRCMDTTLEGCASSVVTNNVDTTKDTQNDIQTWNDSSTKLLIHFYKDLHEKVGKTFNLKTKNKLWETIKTKMDPHGYDFTPLQIENKWKTLERAVEKKTENNNKTGRNKIKCPYEKELQECMVGKTAIFPEYLLGSSDDGREKHEILEAAGVGDPEAAEVGDPEAAEAGNTTESPSTSRTSTPTFSFKKRDSSVMKELKELRALKEKYYEETNNLKRQKLEAYERRTSEIAKKNELLEKLITNLSK